MSIKPASYPRVHQNQNHWQPSRVLLFSGHMIDAQGRNPPRFPAENAVAAAERISTTLNELQAGPNDLALTQGACGGDILFAEACLQRGVKLQLLQPFTETEFIQNSVTTVAGDWLHRYQTIKQTLAHPPLAAPAELGPLPADLNAYERCNLWLLTSAMAYGPEKLVFICLWDGGGSESPGGTAHMVAEVNKQHGKVIWLDVRQLGQTLV
ncbi:MAG: hypothetical protein CTY19_09650 [Methylomonas sp.]|jgi:hypothetical protein|nr:MAG: hypothetical protein CTY19_09650 [Methylomonas sp.]